MQSSASSKSSARKDARQPPRHHRLAAARRADQQDVVAAGRGDLERALGHALPDDVGEVGFGIGVRRRAMGRPEGRHYGSCRRAGRRPALVLQASPAIQRLHSLDERIDRQHLQTLDDGRLRCIRARQQNRHLALAPRGDRHRQHAANRLNRSVERQLAEQDDAVDQARLDNAARRKHAKRDREVVGRPGLANVGRRQVDGDAMPRKLESRIADGRPNAIPAFADAGVRKTDHRENGKPEGDVDLDDDGQRLDAEDRRASKAGEHGRQRCKELSETSMKRIPYLWMQAFLGIQ